MDSNIIYIFLLFIIVILLILYLTDLLQDNKISKYLVSKTYFNPITPYNNKSEACSKVCRKEICDEYQHQIINYDLCKECNKEFKCYDPYKGICVSCSSGNVGNYSCEKLYGCNNKKPINPVDNYCKKCWTQIY